MDKDEQIKQFHFSKDERDLILGLTSIDLDMEKQFKLAILKDNGVVVDMNAYDLDLLLGYIATDANNIKERAPQKKLQKLFDRVTETLESEYPT